ncbi:hypothetical protein BKA64DRAFT_662918 [Cadophora sp. MPI-SDFR-AT-0126]|nr:hypothetical protein BKA64DRAFT_662918 [Leotiomycetes sp. MPI-SDFR-AT-0126]
MLWRTVVYVTFTINFGIAECSSRFGSKYRVLWKVFLWQMVLLTLNIQMTPELFLISSTINLATGKSSVILAQPCDPFACLGKLVDITKILASSTLDVFTGAGVRQ